MAPQPLELEEPVPPLPLVSSALSASVTTRVAHAASEYTAATPPTKSNLTYLHANAGQVPLTPVDASRQAVTRLGSEGYVYHPEPVKGSCSTTPKMSPVVHV
jgi:hypothetical protein